ncbi:hypothetical protein A4A49_32960 [Nicotiana attenuata]|uniref:Uncharacterized protein n=1 Tax=Nicotiana attenuata TaxID=49451 RepID=A0A1J6JAV0_NICAT|nr:hypothetical protein A4A49_32960 [Nicotiana attenuata]
MRSKRSFLSKANSRIFQIQKKRSKEHQQLGLDLIGKELSSDPPLIPGETEQTQLKQLSKKKNRFKK